MKNEMIKTGFSLPPAYLAETETAPESVWVRALGQPATALERLRKMGLTSIELRAVKPGMKPELVRAAINNVTRHRLKFTIHGALPPTDEQVGTVEGFPLWALADEIAETQGEVTIPLHARFALEGELEPVIAATVAALRRLLDERDRRRAPFRFALEINRAKAKIDPSFTWDGVAAIVETVNHPALGICWDFGHAFYNYRAGLIAAEPPAAFLEKVIHTHIHDLNSNGKTHFPLREGVVPLARYCELLRSVGYDGVYNLELDPARYPDDAELGATLYDSVATLIETTHG